MGNVFSKKDTVKDKLLNLESDVIKGEYELNSLKRASIFGKALFITPVLTAFAIYMACLFEVSLVISLLVLFSFLTSFFYILQFVSQKRIEIKEKRLMELKKDRKNLIEQCKNDINFSITKSLIEKYEEAETRDTFFSQIKRKKKTAMDNVTDFILGNDPSKMLALICTQCGMHNGLVDQSNDVFNHFNCYHCGFRNERKQNLTKN
ncbi:hypothetical protein GINT2_001436 [Glugoides intestinalis]